MYIDIYLVFLCIASVNVAYQYLLSIEALHQQLNSFAKSLTSNTSLGIEQHNNSERLGWSDKVIGCKNKVIYEKTGNNIKYGSTTKSIEVSGYSIIGICQCSTGWLALYSNQSSPYADCYKFRLWDDTCTTNTEYILTTQAGYLNVSNGSLFSFDGTYAYFKQSGTGNNHYVKRVNVLNSVQDNLPMEHFVHHGTTKLTYCDKLVTDGTKIYYFDELRLDYWNRLWTYQNASGTANSQMFFYDGTYFYFPTGMIEWVNGSGGNVGNSVFVPTTLTAKKVV